MNTICEFLACDHQRCDELFAQVAASVTHKDWPAADADFLQFRRLLLSHLDIEERFLFPAFEKSMEGAGGPLAMLLLEHQRISGLLERMQQALQRREALDFLLHVESYALLSADHSMKEEGMLYRLLDRTLGDKAVELVRAMCAARTMHDAVAPAEP